MKKSVIIIIVLLVAITCLASGYLSLQRGRQNITIAAPYFGIAGFSPIGFPQLTTDSVNNYLADLSKYSSIYGVHTSLEDSKVVDIVGKNYQQPIVLITSHTDVQKVELILSILQKTSQIKYLGLGNEVNLLRQKDLAVYNQFVSDYKKAYAKIKTQFPAVNIFTVFNYESLLKDKQIELIKDFSGSMDMLGITTYPFAAYQKPENIPSDYFSPLSGYRIAITETGWPSGYKTFTEQQQFEYATWLRKNITQRKENFEFANWLFLNDLKNTTEPFDTVGLRDKQGTEKKAFAAWTTQIN